MPVAELILDNPSNEFDNFYIKVKDQASNLVVYSASLGQFSRLQAEVGDLPGLYILQADDSTVYVGQSKELRSRLRTHQNRRKIGFTRILAVVRDQSLAQYLDYAEAKIYQELRQRGFLLDQSSLSGSLETKRQRLIAQDKEHARTADAHVNQFLGYAVALGLVKPTKALDTKPVPPASSDKALSSPTLHKRKSVKLVIKDAKGRPFEGKHSADVFVEALRYLGLPKLAALNLKLGGHPLLQQGTPQRYSSEHKQIDGYYVNTHSSNKDKVKLLRQAAGLLKQPLTVVEGHPADAPTPSA